MKKYDGWTLKNRYGSLLFHYLKYTRKGVIREIGVDRWLGWKEQGDKIVKVRLVEVKEN